MAQHAHLPRSRAAESIGLLKQLPPRAANALSGFADIVRGLRSDASQLPPAELVRKLNERSGLLAALRAQCKTEQLFKIRRGNLDELADWFEHAGRNGGRGTSPAERSEEHTSELQSLMRSSYAVFCLKKKT